MPRDSPRRRARPRRCGLPRGSRARAPARRRGWRAPQRIARAGPSNSARKPSPAVSTSSPQNRPSSRRTAAWCAASSVRPRASPSSPHARVEPTMSVKRSVARTRSAHRHGPRAREELLHLVEHLVHVDPGDVVVARRARRTARPGCARRCSGLPRRCESRSPVRWSTSVGTARVGSTSRTSTFEFIRIRSRARGRAERRARRAAGTMRLSAASALGSIVDEVDVLAPGLLELRGVAATRSSQRRAPTGNRSRVAGASRRCRRGRARASAPDTSRRTGRTSARPPSSRRAPPARCRPRPSPPGRRPSASRDRAGPTLGRRAPCRACRSGSAARTSRAGRGSARAGMLPVDLEVGEEARGPARGRTARRR